MMNLKKFILSILFLAIFQFSFSQELKSSDSIKVIRKYYVSVGGIHTKYQNKVQSQVIFSGNGGGGYVGTSREKANYLWDANFSAYYTNLYAWTHYGWGDNSNYKLSFSYLRKLKPNFFIGGQWDVFEYNIVYIPDLYNNSYNVLFNSTMSPKICYQRKVSENFNAYLDFSIGLLGAVRESSSFAYSAAQKVLEKGEFDYQNTSTTGEFALKYSYLAYPIRMNKWQSNLVVQWKKRLELFYNWQMVNYRFIKGYARTNSMHTVGLTWNIKNTTVKK